MGHELSIYVQVVLSGRDTQSWDIDGYMKYTEESQREHRRDRIGKGCPIDSRKV